LTKEELKNWENRLFPGLVSNIEFIVNNIPDDGILYDIGANTGLLTSHILNYKPELKVFMFEPVKEYYSHVMEKFSNNHKVTMFRCALSDTDGSTKISIHADNKGYNTLTQIREYGSTQEIPTARLSTMIDNLLLPVPDIMKIDVEESEYLVINGYEELMNRGHLPKIIYMEIGIREGHMLWNKEKEMIEYLFSLGYERFDYENKNNTYDAVFKLNK
jgi:FkbM family methyltransferase